MAEWHSLSAIDADTRTANCAVCGPTRIRLRVGKSSECWTVRMRHQHKRRPETRRARALEAAFGISVDDYDRMLAEQGGVCAICGSPPTQRRLAVDHDHSSGAVRGLLCTSCNIGLGNFADEARRLAAAITYLRRSA